VVERHRSSEDSYSEEDRKSKYNRSNKSTRSRKSKRSKISKGVKKTESKKIVTWSKLEKKIYLKLVERYGRNFKKFLAHLPGRNLS
jgi:hypothetical protein